MKYTMNHIDSDTKPGDLIDCPCGGRNKDCKACGGSGLITMP